MSIFSRASIARYSRKFHLFMAWTGAIALLVFGLSGITHPIMSWTGPEQAKFFPPQLAASVLPAGNPMAGLARHGIGEAADVRIVPSFDGPVLQVLERPGSERRYFSLADGVEIEGRDREHAIWLARYYTGLAEAPLAKVTFQTAFDDDYPWVNRLLPVWRIEFDTPDQRRAFIYTELNALAAQHNGNRHVLQTIFQALHTWSWLDATGNGRVVLLGLFMTAILGMLFTGIAMIFTFKQRAISDGNRRWHRRMAYIVWLPVFMFTASGAYHLLQSHYGTNTRGLKVGEPMRLAAAIDAPDMLWASAIAGRSANSVSIVAGPQGLLVRVERPATATGAGAAPAGSDHGPAAGGEHAHHAPVSREQRFRGVPTRGEIVYLDLVTGERWGGDDRTLAIHLAERLGGARADEIRAVEEISRFGLGYDFRNKRLPVWQIALDDETGRTLFIDTGANLLVDQVSRLEFYETVSFSLLHKWNFLRPLGGKVMDAIVVSAVLLCCVAALFGMGMLIAGKRHNSRRAPSPNRPKDIAVPHS